ncbi:hypothetical protein Q1695_012810 [Nippostrongylus brasiliensis]|nr:hypothetical protein Q1695_012810 [Nippostrongylus brasiliensis]
MYDQSANCLILAINQNNLFHVKQEKSPPDSRQTTNSSTEPTIVARSPTRSRTRAAPRRCLAADRDDSTSSEVLSNGTSVAFAVSPSAPF